MSNVSSLLPDSSVLDNTSTNRAAILAAAESATRRVAPLWPLENFVAVNPFLAYSGEDFGETAKAFAHAAGARLTMPRSFYLEAHADGRLTDVDLRAALAEAHDPRLPKTPAELMTRFSTAEWEPVPLPTVADIAAKMTGRDWPGLAVDRLSSWAASYFDRGQASWRAPWQGLPAYEAWQAEASRDRTPGIMGLAGFRTSVKEMPGTADDAIEFAVLKLGVPAERLEDYLHRLLMTVSGWAGYARGLQWNAELAGGTDGAIRGLLAARLAWDIALLEGIPGLKAAWNAASRDHWAPSQHWDPELAMNLVVHDAFERGAQRRLLLSLEPTANQVSRAPAAPGVQAAFCIDVRSEVMRRHFEAQSPRIETIGFAGFFGIAMEFVPFGQQEGGAHCPVLLSPGYRVEEHIEGASAEVEGQWAKQFKQRARGAKTWKSFKQGAVASFGFVETAGLGYAAKLVRDSFGRTKSGQARTSGPLLLPRIDAVPGGPGAAGIPHEDRAALAEGILRGMSKTSDFGRFFLLVGHGANTTNNPHATGLDCGACGGHGGDQNALVAAALLNDPAVREALRSRDIDVPVDTVFLACRHDTTADVITILDRGHVPASHLQDLAELDSWLAAAGGLARRERAPRLGLALDGQVDDAIVARTRDWSQVRPEWGLAGCAAFIAAPRERTAGINLGGRAFLHSYDSSLDDDYSGLERIMTAPMVVASWISLQYFASTVDNTAFGAGNKVLHNIAAGSAGVLEGSGGDLRVGLPLQSVHDGTRWVHEPVRLSVVIEAPTDAINQVIRKHAAIRDLVDNGWIHLFAMNGAGVVASRYAGDCRWEQVGPEPRLAESA